MPKKLSKSTSAESKKTKKEEAQPETRQVTEFEKNFNAPDLKDISYEDQTLYFKSIQALFTDLNLKQARMSIENYRNTYISTIEDIAAMAVVGNVPAMDYLCFLYKRGIDNILPRNLARAHEWGIFAVAAGSKLSIERLRLFFEPVYDYVIDNGDVDAIESKNNLNDDDVAEFVAYSFCNVLIDEMGLSLLEQSKKGIIQEENFQEFSHRANDARDRALPKMLELIS